MRLFARRVHDIERHAGHVGDHDSAVGRLAFDFRRPRIGVALRPVVAFGQQLLLQRGNDIAVFGMHQRQRAQFGAALERREHLVVIDHQRALVGHEVLEGVDPLLAHHLLHLVEHLLAPPGDRHVEGVVTIGARRLVVPHLDGVEQRLAGRRQREIDHHGGAAGDCGAGAALEIIGRIGAHERHFEVGVRIDAARHHVATRRVDLVVGMHLTADGDDLVMLDENIGLPSAVGGDDGSVSDDF